MSRPVVAARRGLSVLLVCCLFFSATPLVVASPPAAASPESPGRASARSPDQAPAGSATRPPGETTAAAAPTPALALSPPLTSTLPPALTPSATVTVTPSLTPTLTPTATPSLTPAATPSPMPTLTPPPPPTPTPEPPSDGDQVVLTPEAGGVLSSTDGWLRIQAPPGAVTQTLLLSYRPALLDLAGGRYLFELELRDPDSGAPVPTFALPVTLTTAYTPAIVRTLGGQLPRLLRFDPPAGSWQAFDSRVDPQAMEVTAIFTATGLFGLTPPPDEGRVSGILAPSVLGVQVSEWTGDASFQYPIETPPGPAGFGPSVSLAYSNGAANGMLQQIGPGDSHTVQAGFAGLGWSLGGLGSISRANDGTYSLSFPGGSFELQDDGGGWWHTVPESFLRIYHASTTYGPITWEAVSGGCQPPTPFLGQAEVRYQDTGAWTIWTQDGAEYTFGSGVDVHGVPVDLGKTPIRWGGWLECGHTCYANQGDHTCGGGLYARPYRWNLVEVRDTHDNTYNVSYAHDLQAISGNTSGCPSIAEVIAGKQYVRDTRPTSLNYGSGLNVQLPAASDRDDDPADLHLDDTNCTNQAMWTDWRLAGVQVRVNSSVIRGYTLAGQKQGHHWVLETITPTGAGGSGQLPAYSFTYQALGGNNGVFLTQAGNGYGGSAGLSYQDRGDAYPSCGRYVVSHRDVGDGLGHTASTGYQYEGAAAEGVGCDDEEYEFLGFGTVTSTVYVLDSETVVDHRAVTRFHQHDDQLNGKEYRAQVLAPDGALVQQTDQTWSSSAGWARLDVVTTTSYDGGVSQARKTAYYYDVKWQNCGGSGTAQYGNLTRVAEYASATAPSPSRTTLTGYCPNTVAWVVDKVAFRNVYEGGIDPGNPSLDQLRASTWYIYDDNQTGPDPHWNRTAGSKGELRGVRRMLQWTPAFQVVDTRYRHDAYGNVTQETVYNSYGSDGAWAASNPRTTTTTYDSSHHTFPIQVVRPAVGGYTPTETRGYYEVNESNGSTGFGLLGQVKRVRDTNNGTDTWSQYDAFGRLLYQWLPGDTPLWTTGRASLAHGYNDTTRRLYTRRRDDSGGANPTYLESWQFYDGLGRPVQSQAESEAAGQIILTNRQYDALGRLEKESVPYEVTAAGGAYQAPDWNRPRTGYSYDAVGRATQVVNPDGTVGVTAYHGWQKAVIDENDHLRVYEQDAFGRLGKVHEYLGEHASPLWDGSGAYAATLYGYDVLDNLVQVTDAAGNETAMSYDRLGRKTAMDDPDMGLWDYGYDALGNLTVQDDANHQRLCFYYDELNRLKGKAYTTDTTACPSEPAYAASYGYDVGSYGQGRRTSMSDGSGATSWTYDARGRLSQESKVINGSGAFLTQWSYDALDRVAAMTYPGGNGGQIGEQVTTTYNAQGLPLAVAGAATYVSQMTYDALGRVDLMQLGTTPTVKQIGYVYYPWTTPNGQGRLQQIRTGTAGTPTDVQDLQYGYDAVGNVLSIVDSKVDGGPQTQGFGYDALDRLLSAAAAGGSAGQGQYSEAYVYNNVGNMTSKGGVSYGYDDAAHKHAVTHLGGVQKYWYDANGNMTQRIVGSDTFEQSWDAENRLAEVRKNSSVVATYTYDGDGQRVQATVNGQTTAYVGNYLEWSGNTGTMVRYYYAGSQRVAMRKGSALYYLLGDHLGSTAVTVDSSGSKVAELRYKAYGETRYSYSTTPTNYRFTGQRWEYSVKLYQMGARWYDPSLARWISADPVCPTSTDYSQFSLVLTVSYAETSVLTLLNAANTQGDMSSEPAGLLVPENPQLCNRFSYAVNNPLGFMDPSGHDPIPPWRRWASKVCGAFAAVLDTLALELSGVGVMLEGAGLVGVPVTVGEEPLTFGVAALLYNNSLNLAENRLSVGAFFLTAAGDFFSGDSYIKVDPFTVAIGQDTAVSLAGIVTGNTALTPEALTDSGVNLIMVGYDYGRLLELIPTGFEIRVIQVTEDGVQILELVPVTDK